MSYDEFLAAAIEEARKGLADGGIPIGSVLVIDDTIVGRGHNQRVQKGSPVLHAEMDCLENAGRLSASEYRRATLYSTLSPCDMCSGTVLLYGIPNVVIGENRTFRGPEDYLRSRGVDVLVADDLECRQLMETFIATYPELWNEDIGEIAGGTNRSLSMRMISTPDAPSPAGHYSQAIVYGDTVYVSGQLAVKSGRPVRRARVRSRSRRAWRCATWSRSCCQPEAT